MFFIMDNHIIYARDTYEAYISAMVREYRGERLKYIENSKDLVNYMYELFLLGKGAVVAYTGKEHITLDDIDRYIEQVIRIDKPGLLDCEVLWGNIDGYNKAVSYTDEYTLICVCPVYRHTQEEMRKLDRELDDIVNGYGWSGKDQMTREEKAKLVHDYIIDNFEYDTSFKNFDDYDGFFCNKDGQRVMVCQGYALLTYKLLNRLDVPCKIIMSKTHSWNIVQLEDGFWYHLDCTNDDLGIYGKQRVYDFFLKPELDGSLYDYYTSCVLYDNLEHYEFGSRKYSKTEMNYILNRVLVERDLSYLLEKLACIDVKIMASIIFLVSISVFVMAKKRIRIKKAANEKKFLQYNNL